MLAAMLAAALLGLAAASRVAAATGSSGVQILTLVRPAPRFPATYRTARTFQLVGGRWSGTGRLQVRSSGDGQSWSRWVPFSAESPTWTGNARAVQVRRASGGSVRDLRISFITSPPQAVAPSVMPATTIRPPIITRAGWGANESWRRGPPSYAPALKMVFVHHTDTTNLYSCTSSAQIVRGIYAYHVKNNGWNDIGYNFLIDRCGHVFEGRYGGVDKPVIGAQTLGMNTGSAGIALIGTFTSSRPTTAAMTALERLIAWRLDVAHVNPLSRAYMISSGNEYFHPGQGVWLRAVSGHRDGSATTCPGEALYALIPAVAMAAYAIGLPKIFASRVYGHFVRVGAGTVQPLSVTATFSHLTQWAARVLDPHGRTVAMRVGTGTSMRWNWSGTAGVLPAGLYHWEVSAPGATPVVRPLGVLPVWAYGAPPVSVSGSIASGGVSDLLAVDGSVLTATQFTTVDRLPVTELQFDAAVHVGVHLTDLAGERELTMELWNFHTGSWVTAGGCTTVAGHRCDVLIAAAGGVYGRWDAGSGTVEMRARFTADAPLRADFANTSANGLTQLDPLDLGRGVGDPVHQQPALGVGAAGQPAVAPDQPHPPAAQLVATQAGEALALEAVVGLLDRRQQPRPARRRGRRVRRVAAAARSPAPARRRAGRRPRGSR